MEYVLPRLPYEETALAPHMSRETLEYHHGKHHQAYVNNLNRLIEGTPFASMPLEEIIAQAEGPIFNNAAQVWNHTFFFDSFSPDPKSVPAAALGAALDRDFGSLDAFKNQFTDHAASLFGSGWTWLVSDPQGKLSIRNESNAGNPLRSGGTPLLAFDVWEHAYYIDYRNRRADYLSALWHLVDWSVVEVRYAER